MPIEPMLVADSIGKRFGARRVLTAASIRVVPEEIRALVGRNGAGKSTLLRIAAGLDVADHGVIIWSGQRMLRSRLARLARTGLLFLPSDGLLAPARRLGVQLQLVADTFGTGSTADAIQAMRLESVVTQQVHQLSGGERRRADVAVALIRQPSCLLADELFRDSSPLDCELIGQTLQSLAQKGCAIMVTGHELLFLMRYADHVTWCTTGTTHELGSPEDAERNDAFRADFLGVPWRAASA